MVHKREGAIDNRRRTEHECKFTRANTFQRVAHIDYFHLSGEPTYEMNRGSHTTAAQGVQIASIDLFNTCLSPLKFSSPSAHCHWRTTLTLGRRRGRFDPAAQRWRDVTSALADQ